MHIVSDDDEEITREDIDIVDKLIENSITMYGEHFNGCDLSDRQYLVFFAFMTGVCQATMQYAMTAHEHDDEAFNVFARVGYDLGERAIKTRMGKLN